MNNIYRFIFCFCLIGFSYLLHSQSELLNTHQVEQATALSQNHFLKSKTAQQSFSKALNSFVIDTLELPFLDDFASNKQKVYDQNQVISQTVFNRFTLGSSAPDSIVYSASQTYLHTYNLTNQNFDTTENIPFNIYMFENPSNISLASDTLLVWPAYDVTDSLGQIDSVLSAQVLRLYNPDTLFVVADDGRASLWMDRNTNVYINNRFDTTAITLGMATFDGLDYKGEPYDNSSEFTYGRADELTSKPINLSYVASDSILFSFYFKAAGLGNAPEFKDSLVLEFFAPASQSWKSVWKSPGNQSQSEFEYVQFFITDTAFLKKGFQFRFANYGSLYGMFDLWHIDYVYLNKQRSQVLEDIQDVGYSKDFYSMIDNYASMPWKHYQTNPSLFTTADVDFEIKNLSANPRLVERKDYFFDVDQTILHKDSSVYLNFETGPLAVDLSVNSAPNNFLFASNLDSTADFVLKDFVVVNPDINRSNDTLIHHQFFGNYYAYDDGSAELSYRFAQQGNTLALKFNTQVADTLKGLLVYFTKNEHAFEGELIELSVFDDLNTSPIYTKTVAVQYGYGLNGFTRYDLTDTALIVDGDFYIGFKNITDQAVYLGLDKNRDNSNNLSLNFNDGSGWFSSSVEGSVMLRADFGFTQVPVSAKNEHIQKSLKVYPNPSTGRFFFDSDQDIQEVLVIDHLARSTRYDKVSNQLDLSDLAKGLYSLRVVLKDATVHHLKVILQ